MSTREEVYSALDGERAYQESLVEKTGPTADNGKHSPEEFLLYMQDYLTEATHVASRTWGAECHPKVLAIVRKVTALGVACMEANGAPRREGF